MLWLVLAEVSKKGIPWLRASCSPLSLSTALFASQSHLLPISSRSTSEEACWRRREWGAYKSIQGVTSYQPHRPAPSQPSQTHHFNILQPFCNVIEWFLTCDVIDQNNTLREREGSTFMSWDSQHTLYTSPYLQHDPMTTLSIVTWSNDHTLYCHMIWWPHPLLSHDWL